VDIAVILKPAFRPSEWFVKAGFLFCAVLMFLAAAVRFIPLFRLGESRAEHLTRLILAGFLGTMAASFMSIILHPDSFFGFAVRHGVRLPQTGVFNAVLGLLLVLALAGFRKFRLPLFLWPLVLSAATIPIFPVFRLDVCGDAHEWMSLLTMHGRNLYGAELLSFPLAKAAMNLGRVFVPSLSQDAALVLTGKLMGILTLFALAWFISGETRLSREKKVLFLILASTLGYSALLIGYPEFAYFPLPFLLAAAGSARRFLGPGGGRNRDVMLSSFWTTTAGLFHGSAWIILPAVFLMPLLRARETERPAGFGRIVMAWAAAGGIAAAVILGSFWTARALGFKILMRNISGGGDGEMFVNFVDKSTIALSGVLAFEARYLWERAWAFFLAIPLPFLLWAILSIRRLKEQIADRFLLAAGILSLSIFFFWNFDLGYRDFDLYIIPLTLIVLLLMKWLLETAPAGFSPRLEALLVFLCALASPIALILQMTTVSLF